MSAAFKIVVEVEEVKTLNSICVNGITFAVEFFLVQTGNSLRRSQVSSAKYFCIWYKCTDEERQIIGD